MQIPESWLREFCNPALNTTALADALTMAGFEVEDIRPAAPVFTGVVVGQIVSCEQHPNADRLRVCGVQTSADARTPVLQVVCGAPNARVGIRVPLAQVGAQLPPAADGKPLHIGQGKLRGVDSFGMLCSAAELGIDEDASGLLELSADAPLGVDLRQVLTLDDMVLTLKLTPNLGHAMSVYGIARELSAITGAPLKVPHFQAVAATTSEVLAVHVQAADLCGRFSGRVVQGVNPKARTPDWMVQRLARCGQRSVSALVDISNYVMFEFGRPSHIFDRGQIHGDLVVRWGRAGESVKLLNGNTIEVDEQVGVIADDRGVEALAGIMGGDATAVSDDTHNIYIEAAFWWPQAVQGRSRRYNFSTDAGQRFERGVDPSLTVEHIEHITQLVQHICGGQAGPMTDHIKQLPARPDVTLRVARAAKVIGMPVSAAQCLDVMQRLQLPAKLNAAGDAVMVSPPSYRFDLALEEDLIEEVARIIGFAALPDTAPLAPVAPQARSEHQRDRFALRHALAALGYQETISFSFVEEAWEADLAGNTRPVRLLNPIAAPLAVMRSTLMGSLLQVLKHNLDRRAERARVFEIGRVFMRDPAATDGSHSVAGVHQPMRVGGLVWGPAQSLQWGSEGSGRSAADFFDIKGDVQTLLAPLQARYTSASGEQAHPALHPGRAAAVWVGDACIGHVGELHPRWAQKWELPAGVLLFELDLAGALQRPLPRSQGVPRQQPVRRDVALVVADEVSHDALLAAVQQAPTGGLVQSAVLFDVFRPSAGRSTPGMVEGEKSMALRLTLVRDEALTEAAIEGAVAAVVSSVTQALGARLRA
jgi:phenylalanyl-tRNA synthetase beta chain